MTSGTDSDSGSSTTTSSEEYKRRRASKNRKRKSERKEKKHKKEKKRKPKKRSRRSSSGSDRDEGPREKSLKMQPQPMQPIVDAAPVDDVVFGAALPPHLMQKAKEVSEVKTPIGPILPKDFKFPNVTTEDPSSTNDYPDDDDDDDDDGVGVFGPMPTGVDGVGDQPMTEAQIELEQRALELKIAALGGDAAEAINQKEREEWMLTLPEVGLKGGLAALANMKRKFHQGKEKPDFSDRSSWTKTPQSEKDKQKASTSKSPNDAESLKKDAQAIYERKRDKEQESVAKKLKKKQKREESLVELHQKQLRKEQKRKAKELLESGVKPERRPFSREVDFKLNKIDRNQTKQIVDKAKVLNTKFSSGQAKYL